MSPARVQPPEWLRGDETMNATENEARDTLTAMIHDDASDDVLISFRAAPKLMAAVAEAGDQISYAAAKECGDMAWDDFARALRGSRSDDQH